MRLIQTLLVFLLVAVLASCTPKIFSPVTSSLKPGEVGTNITTNCYLLAKAVPYTPPVTGLNNPWGICFDPSGNYYVTVAGANSINKYDSSDAFVGAWGSGNPAFNFPNSIVYHPSGFIFVSDRSNHRIQKFNASTGVYISFFGSLGTGTGNFNNPTGLAVDRVGNLWVCDSGNHRIKSHDVNGTYLSTIGSFGTGNGQFKFPLDVAIDTASDAIHVCDYSNNRFQAFGSTGAFVFAHPSTGTTAGTNFGEYALPTAIATHGCGYLQARMDGIHSNNSRMYFVETTDYPFSYSLINTNGSFGTGNNNFSNAHGLSFSYGPLATNLYVCDSENGRVTKWLAAKFAVITNIITNNI